MRTLILITGFVLASATAQAGERSLSLGPVDTPAVAAPAKTTEATKTAEAPQAEGEAPKYVERPAPAEAIAEAPKAETAKAEQMDAEPARPVVRKTASARKARKSWRRHYWTEARIISELHRHGIYW